MSKEFIKLQNSHVTQHTNGHIKSDWSLEANQTDEKLALFDKTFSEKQMFDILDFARKYELIAFNEGIKFGKSKSHEVFIPKIKILEDRIEFMKAENERLALALENLYISTHEEI